MIACRRDHFFRRPKKGTSYLMCKGCSVSSHDGSDPFRSRAPFSHYISQISRVSSHVLHKSQASMVSEVMLLLLFRLHDLHDSPQELGLVNVYKLMRLTAFFPHGSFSSLRGLFIGSSLTSTSMTTTCSAPEGACRTWTPYQGNKEVMFSSESHVDCHDISSESPTSCIHGVPAGTHHGHRKRDVDEEGRSERCAISG